MFQKVGNGCVLEATFWIIINSRPSGVKALMIPGQRHTQDRRLPTGQYHFAECA
jgi:hypothetical protein